MSEYVAPALGVIAGVSSAIAYVYRRGRSSAIDMACEQRIKKDISDVKIEIVKMEGKGDEVHGKIFDKIDNIDSKIDKVIGSVDIIKNLITKD